MPDLEINLRVTPRALRWAAVGFLLCGFAREFSAESFTMTTTYPAPTGVYNRLITTGDAFLARDGNSRVGIGTTNPQYKLDVNGSANIGSSVTVSGTVAAGDVQVPLVNGQSVITTIVCPAGSGCTATRTDSHTYKLTVP